MADSIALYLRYLAVSIRGQLQYRASFIMAALGQFLVTSVEVIGLWALFDRFGHLKGWTLPEVALFYGTVNIAFALADALANGFDTFSAQVRSGSFDRLLLRPRSTVLQLFGHELALRRIGRLAQGTLVFAWAVAQLDSLTPADAALIAAAIVGGACLFIGLIMLQATMAFWTVESLEVVNAFTYGGVYAAQYPITIYADWFRQFFTFIVPLAAVSYFPLILALGKPDPLGTPPWLQAAAPLAGPIFLLLALGAWKRGVHHYTSTGS